MVTRKISEKQVERLIADLNTLAYNLWWSWNPRAQQIFHELSPFFWEHSNHNAVEVMKWVSGQELKVRLQNPALYGVINGTCRKFQDYMTGKNSWAKRNWRLPKTSPVAYFSAEFGLHESLPIYSGGLGILAGDYAKSASDLGIPFVGVSLLYRQGYFQQRLTHDGWQQERYPTNDPSKLAVSQVIDSRRRPVVCTVTIGGKEVRFCAWVANVGRVRLFLLDTNLPENEEGFRNLTSHVYGGDQWTRIGQEIVLGIGGVRLLRSLGISPAVFHMNEGHSAFLTLELMREQLEKKRQAGQALDRVRNQCVFTTHTPVPAGHDRFDRGLMDGALGGYTSTLGIGMEDMLRLGRVHQDDPNEPFTMTVLALRMSRAANGVSELHGKVSREMWKDIYPSVSADKVPISHITNGVHIAGWTTPTAMQFWSDRLGPGWIARLSDASFWQRATSARTLTDEELWSLRTALRRELIEFVRRRLREQDLMNSGQGTGLFDSFLSPDALTIGFARRFATYKRAPLFFRDIGWAIRTMTDPSRPVQIIFAGKAHPRDDAGKYFIQQIVNISRRTELFGRVVFIENYDVDVARHLVAGADVWLNTPRRPMEACGTSGMKTIVHGVLQASTMDGWWREAFDGHNGWAIGDDHTSGNEQEQDDQDAAALRSVFEKQIIPLFYERGRDRLPHKWLAMVRHAMATLIPAYNTERMVKQYAAMYTPGQRRNG